MSNQQTLLGVSGDDDVFRYDITTNQQELDLTSALTTAGWDGSKEVIVTISSGVYVWSDSTSTPALTTGSGSFPNGLKIIVAGYILGKGGTGGEFRADGTVYNGAGASGGPALNLTVDATVEGTSSGYIGGGGGGGGGAYSSSSALMGGGGGAGGGQGGNLYNNSNVITHAGGSGGSVGSSGGDSTGVETGADPEGGGAGGQGGGLSVS